MSRAFFRFGKDTIDVAQSRQSVRILRSVADILESCIEQDLLDLPPQDFLLDIDPIVIHEAFAVQGGEKRA